MRAATKTAAALHLTAAEAAVPVPAVAVRKQVLPPVTGRLGTEPAGQPHKPSPQVKLAETAVHKQEPALPAAAGVPAELGVLARGKLALPQQNRLQANLAVTAEHKAELLPVIQAPELGH